MRMKSGNKVLSPDSFLKREFICLTRLLEETNGCGPALLQIVQISLPDTRETAETDVDLPDTVITSADIQEEGFPHTLLMCFQPVTDA